MSELKVKCAKCGKEISFAKAEMFDVPVKVCVNLEYAREIGRTILFLCSTCSQKYKIVEEYMGVPIIVPKTSSEGLPEK